MKSIFCAIGFASIASAAAVHAEAAVHARDVVNARDVANAQKAAVTFTSTDVVSTTQGCYNAVATTAPGFQCNVAGTVTQPSMIAEIKEKPLQECQNLCLFDETCLVFGYNKKTNECQTFKKSLKQMSFDSTVASGFIYSNRHCITCDPNPSSVSSSTSVSTTSKSTSAKHSHGHSVSSSSATSSSTKVKPSSSSSSSQHENSASTKKSSSAPKSASTKNSTSAPKPKATKSKSSSSSLTSVSTSSSASASATKTKASKTKSTAVASASASAVNGHATCTESSVAIPQSTQTYTQYFVGAGVTETPVNPGNDNSQQAPINSTLSGTYGSDCDAIAACAKAANFAAYQYYSFDLHFVNSTQQWICTQYYDPNTKPEYFNVKNDDVVVAYGYYNPNF